MKIFSIFVLLLFGISALACVSFAQNTSVAPPSDNSACSRISSDVLAKLQVAQFVDTKPTSHDDGHFRTSTCYYRMNPDYQSVSLEIISHSRSGHDDPSELWNRKFHAEKTDENSEAREKKDGDREEAEENEHHKPPEHVDGVGDDAYWVDTGRDGALYVLKGDEIFRLSLGGRTPQQEKRTRAVTIANSALRR